MTKQIKITKEQRADLLAKLAVIHPELKLGRTSSATLLEMYQAAQEEQGALTMGEILSRYRPGYVVGITPNGRKSRNNGDAVADALEGYDALQIIKAAEKLLEMKKGELQEKYEGMNQGQARMNAGNRIRGAVRRGEVTIDEVEKAIAKG